MTRLARIRSPSEKELFQGKELFSPIETQQPSKTHKKYCKNKCKEYSLAEQYRINNRNYYHRYKNVMTERQKGGLGSKGANLHGKADPNPLAELEKVRNAKRALGLKPIQ